MPELPEVETMRRQIACVVGARIAAIERVPCPRKPIAIKPRIDSFSGRIVGCRIAAADRIGKRVLLRLDSEDAVVFEPRMTGLVLLADPPDPQYLRLRISLVESNVRELFYWDRRGLGNVRLLNPRQITAELGPARLGPDALSITADQLQTRFAGSRREIKVGLLDQKAVAGIGNLYAAEILHQAGIHPQKRCDRLSVTQWEAIAACTRDVLELAVQYEGSTLSDGTYRNVLSQNGRYQNEHRVYDRAGQPCTSCKRGKICRIVQCQRATFFCPRCQKKRGFRTG